MMKRSCLNTTQKPNISQGNGNQLALQDQSQQESQSIWGFHTGGL
jgi:hypothetical protein